ncbi:hypothetical protein JVU11DRAFT_7211 [Chiua virens]|nr:hypothetical protein JVU11DRAFT_7211 [Chiua virens]
MCFICLLSFTPWRIFINAQGGPIRPCNKRKTQTIVHVAGHDLKRYHLTTKIQQLLANPQEDQRDAVHTPSPLSQDFNLLDEDFHPGDVSDYNEEPADADTFIYTNDPPLPKHHIFLDQSAHHFHVSQTLGKPIPAYPRLLSVCHSNGCTPKMTRILSLFFDHFASTDVLSCQCATLPQVLVHFSLFPTAPSQPRMAVSIDLLAFYHALFERSCNAVNVLSSALHNHYIHHGFRIVDDKCNPIQEPFRCSLEHAIQWYNILLVEVEHHLEATLQVSRDRIWASKQPSIVSVPSTPAPSTPSFTQYPPLSLNPLPQHSLPS